MYFCFEDGGMQTDCEWREGTSGEQVECTGDKLVHGVCGSGGFDSCGRNNDYTFSMQCCGKFISPLQGFY